MKNAQVIIIAIGINVILKSITKND